jgi:hypothetical protein
MHFDTQRSTMSKQRSRTKSFHGAEATPTGVDSQKPELSALEKFAKRTPEEKEEFILLFSSLLREELERVKHKPN